MSDLIVRVFFFSSVNDMSSVMRWAGHVALFQGNLECFIPNEATPPIVQTHHS